MVPPDLTFYLPKLLRQLLTRLLTRAADAGLLNGDTPLLAGDVQHWFFGASMRVLLARGSLRIRTALHRRCVPENPVRASV
jgi:hypothetical protein